MEKVWKKMKKFAKEDMMLNELKKLYDGQSKIKKDLVNNYARSE